MKKSVIIAAIAALALIFTGCPQPGGGQPDNRPLTEKIADNGDKDFAGKVIAEDAEVNAAKTISNLDLGGKTLTVNVSGVVLKNITNANVIAAEGIKEGDLTIDGCTLLGLKVLGGGKNSIHLKGTTAETLVVEKEGVRLDLQEETKVEAIAVNASNIILNSATDVVIEKLEIKDTVETIEISGGTITEIEVTTEDGTVSDKKPSVVISGETEIKTADADTIKVAVTEEAEDKVTLPTEVIPEVITLLSKDLDVSLVKASYKVNEEFDVNGISVTKTYSNGSTVTEQVTKADVKVEGFDSSKEGACTVTITYKELTAELKVAVFDDAIKVDLTDVDLGLFFNKNEKFNLWDTSVDLTKYLPGMPSEGDTVKVKVKMTSSVDIPTLRVNLYYDEGKGEEWLTENKNEDLVVINDIKAGVEFTEELVFESILDKRDSLILGLNFDYVDIKEPIVLESGKGVPSVADFIKVESCDEGIKVTLLETEAEEHYLDNLGDINILGSDVRVIIAKDSDGKLVTEYVYPFTTKDKAYYVQFSGGVNPKGNTSANHWATENVKVVAGGGTDLAKYIPEEKFAKYNAIKLNVVYDEEENVFNWGFESEIDNLNDVFNCSEIKEFSADIGMTLGELYWNNATWWAWASFNPAEDGKVNTVKRNWESIDFFEAAKTDSIPFFRDDTTLMDWEKYNYNYCNYMAFRFKLAEYPDYSFSLPTLWSEQCKYNVVTSKDMDLDAALKAGIKGVAADGFVTSEEELKALVIEAIADIAGSEVMANNRAAIVNPKGTPAKNAIEAAAQFKKVVDTVVKVIKEDAPSFADGDIKLKFDETVNLGELTARQWLAAVLDAYDNINKANYGVTSGYVETKTEYGKAPADAIGIGMDYSDYEYKFVLGKEIDTSDLPEGYYVTTVQKEVYGYQDNNGNRTEVGEKPAEYSSWTYEWTEEGDKYFWCNYEYGDVIDTSDLPEDEWLNSGWDYSDGIGQKVYGYYFWNENGDNEFKKLGYFPEGFDGIESFDGWDADGNWSRYYKFQKTIKGPVIDITIPVDCWFTTWTGAADSWGYKNWNTGDVIVKRKLPEGYTGVDSTWDSTTYTTKYFFTKYGDVVEDGWRRGADIWTNDAGEKVYGTIDSFNVMSSAQIRNELNEEVKEGLGISLNKLLETVDEYITIKSFYLDMNGDVDFSLSKLETGTGKIGNVGVEALIDFGAKDIEKAIKEYASIESFPVKAFESVIEAKANADVSYEDVRELMGESEKPTLAETVADVAANFVVKAAVCTKSKKGGIISLDLGANANAKEVLDLFMAPINSEEDFLALAAKLDNNYHVDVAVSNGETNTFSKKYTLADILKIVEDAFGTPEM